ncbi:MAG: SH3 domain-containing protein [Pseudomonadota bacterium]
MRGFMVDNLRLTLLGVMAAGLAACESFSAFDGGSAGGSTDYAAGSRLAPTLTGAGERALAAAFVAAMETGAPQRWAGRHAAGEVIPGGYSLANLRADPTSRIPAARADLVLEPVLETELGLFALTRNSNVRLGPGTNHEVTQTLPSGAGVDVVGKVAGGDWMLAAVDGVVRGYVHKNLMIKAPGAELELAGGPRRQARLCREFRQTMRRYSEDDAWAGAACLSESGEWRLAPEPTDEFEPAILLTD